MQYHRPTPQALRIPQSAGYDTLAHPPPSPRLRDMHTNSPSPAPDLQDDPYIQNPALPPGMAQRRFYGAGALDDYQRASYASSQTSLATLTNPQPSHSSEKLGYESVSNFHPSDSVTRLPLPSYDSNQTLYNDGHDGPDSHQMDLMGKSRVQTQFQFPEKRALYASPREKSRRKGIIIAAIVAAIAVVAAAAAAAVYFFVIRPRMHSGTSSGDGDSSNGPAQAPLPTTGGTGSLVFLEDGSNMTYTNNFGGFWVQDPEDPFNNNAQAQSTTPPLNTTWHWAVDQIRGVNLGGWLTLEPFITPALYQKYPGAVDEYTLSTLMSQDQEGGGLGQLETHYRTFITEADFVQIAGAGLNWVRIPLPFWAIEVRGDEPYLPQVSWQYFLKAITWARKYGLRINLDFHAVPGSQNGWNHSGKLGTINFLNGVMGYANAQRTLTYIQVLAEFLSDPRYSSVVAMFSVLNEAFTSTIGKTQMQTFYLTVHDLIRSISGTGPSAGPMISIHDGFQGISSWAGFLPNSDRITLDTHTYFAFADVPSAAPLSTWITQPCSAWQSGVTNSLGNFGMTIAGEFSLAINDCGLFVNGVGDGTRFEGTFKGDKHAGVGNCSQWDVWEDYTPATKQQLMQFAMSSMDALQHWFFWTWKIGNDSISGSVRAPFWSYQLGLEQGWMPTDPSKAKGSCPNPGFSGTLESWQTGGAGANEIPAATSSALAWPPATISNAGPVTLLPSYTPTGTLITLPVPTFTAVVVNGSAPTTTTIDAGDGWFQPSVTTPAYVPIEGCSYLDEYSGVGVPIPPLCPATRKKRSPEPWPAPEITPPPVL